MTTEELTDDQLLALLHERGLVATQWTVCESPQVVGFGVSGGSTT